MAVWCIRMGTIEDLKISGGENGRKDFTAGVYFAILGDSDVLVYGGWSGRLRWELQKDIRE